MSRYPEPGCRVSLLFDSRGFVCLSPRQTKHFRGSAVAGACFSKGRGAGARDRRCGILRSPLLGSTRPGKPAGNSHEFKTLLHCGFQIVQYLCGWVLFCPFCSSISSSPLGSCHPSFPLCFGEGKDRERGGPRHGVLCCPGRPETRAVLCLCLLGANHSSCHLPPFSKERLSDGQRHQLLPPV